MKKGADWTWNSSEEIVWDLGTFVVYSWFQLVRSRTVPYLLVALIVAVSGTGPAKQRNMKSVFTSYSVSILKQYWVSGKIIKDITRLVIM